MYANIVHTVLFSSSFCVITDTYIHVMENDATVNTLYLAKNLEQNTIQFVIFLSTSVMHAVGKAANA